MWAYRINRILHEGKDRGIRGVLLYVRERLVRANTFLVFELKLTDALPRYSCGPEFTIRPLSASEGDVNRVVDFWLRYHTQYYALFYSRPLVRELIDSRFKAGELCFVAETGGEIVHIHWISQSDSCALNSAEPRKYLQLRPYKDAYSYNICTHPEYRGRGLMLAVYSFLFEWLQERGYERVLSCVGDKNIASIKLHSRVMRHLYDLHLTRYIVFDRVRRRPVAGRGDAAVVL